MRHRSFLGLTVLLLGVAGSAAARDFGDRVDHRLDRKGERIEHRLDARGNHIEARYDRHAAIAAAHGHPRLAQRRDAHGEHIDPRLDRKGEGAKARWHRRSDRFDRRWDRRS